MLRGGTEESPNVKLCSRPCLSAFVFANSVDALQCDLCRKDYDLKANPDIMAGKQVRTKVLTIIEMVNQDFTLEMEVFRISNTSNNISYFEPTLHLSLRIAVCGVPQREGVQVLRVALPERVHHEK